MANKTNNTKVVTGVVRLSYEHVWEPVSVNGGKPKYYNCNWSCESSTLPLHQSEGSLRR